MLFEPLELRGAFARNRVVFGPHVTNLADKRSFSSAHVAYYRRRALGGAGIVVTETASVHSNDWPYERAPLAEQCADGWADIARALADEGAMTIASLGHCGMQGSTTYSQDVLWAPSAVPHVMTHETAFEMGSDHIEELRAATVRAAAVALSAGCEGVELNAGQFSLYRQFMSGLTNQRHDEYAEPLALIMRVLADLRALGTDHVLGLRLSADEMAPWAGITPELAAPMVATLAEHVDYMTIERGSIYSESATRPDMQVDPGFNRELVHMAHDVVGGRCSVVAQGSIVDVRMAEEWVGTYCDAVEMTRALIADPDLVTKAAHGDVASIRPCVLCNQGCQVRDVRNPIVSCAVNPSAGHEIDDAHLDLDDQTSELVGQEVVIVGAGPAGLEAARRSALRGATVRLIERRARIGGAVIEAAQLPGRQRWQQLLAWYEAELVRLNVDIETGRPALPPQEVDLAATGRSIGLFEPRDGVDGSVPVVPASSMLSDPGHFQRVVVIDPSGDCVGVGVAELLAKRSSEVWLVTPDLVAGTQLSLTGDLVSANARLANAGVQVVTHSVVVAVRDGAVVIEDRFDGRQRSVPCELVIDAGFDLPSEPPFDAPVIGDALAPRTVLSAILEGRRFAATLGAAR